MIASSNDITHKVLLPNGSMPVGNYNFFFKYVDADGNETDFIEESGLVTCHVGHLNDPFSIQSGLLDENSNKSIEFVLSNLDGNYEYIRVYYIRSTSDESGVELTKGYMIDKNYIVKQTAQNILITGYENTIGISEAEIKQNNKNFENSLNDLSVILFFLQ